MRSVRSRSEVPGTRAGGREEADMKPEIPIFNVSDSTTKMASAIDEAGCLVVTGMMDDQARNQLRTELDPHMDKVSYAEDDQDGEFYPGKTKRITALIARSPETRKLAVHSVTTAICDHHLLPNCEKDHGIGMGIDEFH